MDTIRNWLIGVTCAAMLAAVADSLTPAGTVKKIGKLTGGLIMLLALMQPILGLDYDALSLALTDYRGDFSECAVEEGSTLNTEMMKSIIEQRTGAYILDKANALGADCSVEVECRVGEENLPYPVAVTVTGALTEKQRQALSREIEAELAVPAEKQTYKGGDTK